MNNGLKTLDAMLTAYRNKERDFPSYEDLAGLLNAQPRVSCDPVENEQIARDAQAIVDADVAALTVGVAANDEGVTVAVHLKQGDQTTVLYTQSHPAKSETCGIAYLPASLFAAAAPQVVADERADLAYTSEEAREQFMEQVRHLVSHWGSENRAPTAKEKLEGLAFSILNIFDGTSGLPAFDIVCAPHPDDKQYCIDEGSRYYVPGMVINDCHLHEMLFSDSAALAAASIPAQAGQQMTIKDYAPRAFHGIEPEPFIIGNQYRTQGGRLVRFVGIANEGSSYETMCDELGHHRYTRRDFGRGTGAAWGVDCVPPLYTAPIPAANVQPDTGRDAALEDEFAAFCERAGYPSDGPMDETLRKAFHAGRATHPAPEVASVPDAGQKPVDWQKIALFYQDLYSQEKHRAPVQPVAVPDGWRLVPIAPTPKMVDSTFGDDMSGLSHNRRNKDIWAAMIAACPDAPAAQGDDKELSDDEIVQAIHSVGVDTHHSRFGFGVEQVEGMSVTMLRQVIAAIAAKAAS